MAKQWTKEARGRYRCGDYLVVHESWDCWRVWFDPPGRKLGKGGCGLPEQGWRTMREARADVEAELAFKSSRPYEPE